MQNSFSSISSCLPRTAQHKRMRHSENQIRRSALSNPFVWPKLWFYRWEPWPKLVWTHGRILGARSISMHVTYTIYFHPSTCTKANAGAESNYLEIRTKWPLHMPENRIRHGNHGQNHLWSFGFIANEQANVKPKYVEVLQVTRFIWPMTQIAILDGDHGQKQLVIAGHGQVFGRNINFHVFDIYNILPFFHCRKM